MEWRIFIGLWLMLILMILAVCELSFLVHYFTRFCEEVFIGIVAIIFIYEAGLSIFHVRKEGERGGEGMRSDIYRRT